MSYRAYTYLTELILILRSIYWSYRTWTCIYDLIHVLQSIYLSYGTYTDLTKHILVLQNLDMISDLIHVLQSIYLSYGSYPCAKVSVGTMSRNRSGSYHIQGQIRLIQIRTLVFRRYRSQIHYTEVTVVTTGLILIRTSHRSYRVLLIQNI